MVLLSLSQIYTTMMYCINTFNTQSPTYREALSAYRQIRDQGIEFDSEHFLSLISNLVERDRIRTIIHDALRPDQIENVPQELALSPFWFNPQSENIIRILAQGIRERHDEQFLNLNEDNSPQDLINQHYVNNPSLNLDYTDLPENISSEEYWRINDLNYITAAQNTRSIGFVHYHSPTIEIDNTEEQPTSEVINIEFRSTSLEQLRRNIKSKHEIMELALPISEEDDIDLETAKQLKELLEKQTKTIADRLDHYNKVIHYMENKDVVRTPKEDTCPLCLSNEDLDSMCLFCEKPCHKECIKTMNTKTKIDKCPLCRHHKYYIPVLDKKEKVNTQ